MATSEIEKLERRYAENPHGLTFAPLAEVHRKNGDVARALELLTAGLELHPNYIPASIVLGRCHQDTGDLPAAEAAFAHVLRLDDENVIALKSLADINEQLERSEEARIWLRRLMMVDRNNEEAREQLERLEIAANGPQPTPQPPEAAVEPPEPEERETRRKRPSAEVVALDLPPVDIAALDVAAAAPAPTNKPAPSSPIDAPPLVLERTQELTEQLVSEKVPSITDAPPPAPAAPVEPVAGLESQEFIPPPPKAPTAFPDSLAIQVELSEEVVLEGSGASEYRVPNAAEDFEEAVATRRPAKSEFRTPQAPEEPKKPVADAASRRREGKEKTADLPLQKSYSVGDTKGQSVAAFFRSVVAARPPSDGSALVPPSPDGASSHTMPTPPAGAGKEEQSPDPGVSFDDFFGSKAEGSRAEKGADSGKDDLDQFHSWLQNLKR